MSHERRYEIAGVCVFALTVLLFLALVTDGYHGDVRRPIDEMAQAPNALGQLGAHAAGIMTLLFGRASHILYCVLGIWGCMLLRHTTLDRLPTRLIGLLMLLSGVAMVLHIHDSHIEPNGLLLGGMLGRFLSEPAMRHLGVVGADVVAIASAIIGLLLSTEFLFLKAFLTAHAWLNFMLRGPDDPIHITRTQISTKNGAGSNQGVPSTRMEAMAPNVLATLPGPPPSFVLPSDFSPEVRDDIPKTAPPIPAVSVSPAVEPPLSTPPIIRIVGMPPVTPKSRTEELPSLDIEPDSPFPALPFDLAPKETAPLTRHEPRRPNPEPEPEPVAQKPTPVIAAKPSPREKNESVLALPEAWDAPSDDAVLLELEEVRLQLQEGQRRLLQARNELSADWALEPSDDTHGKDSSLDETPPMDILSENDPDEAAANDLDESWEDSSPDIEPITEEPALPAYDVEPSSASVGINEDDDAIQLDPEPVAPPKKQETPAWPGARPRKSSGKLMPTRRSLMDDELPPDYVYPKRYTRPPLNLFLPPQKRITEDLSAMLQRTSAILEETLRTFGIEAQVKEITRGPTITRFELEPAPGVKVARFVSLSDDLALALKAHRVRVEAPIPGKGRIGIELPNSIREEVVLRELLESEPFHSRKGHLKLALGKDIAGDVVVADLASMPHLLVAGATGAGKTVCVKTMIASLLCSMTPEELQMMLIDPKMVELSIFNDIPHLITPVVTDPKKASTSLQWLITEMEERYRLFTHLRVRNIEVYNENVVNGEIIMPETDESEGGSLDVVRKLPYIVCIIDELADLMMLARAEVEDAIARLAQLARAVGIHLIIATQRPSVDVLTGVIKANFPARMSFQVSQKVDSRCILDQIGAERLIGRGDMLYLPAGQSKPTRIQGAFVSDDEMNSLIAYLKTQAPPQYRAEIERFGGKDKDGVELLEDEDDELFDDAVRVVLETGQASISMVQRRLRVGYTRAARLIDMMEMRGIVGPHVGSKARDILVEYTPSSEAS